MNNANIFSILLSLIKINKILKCLMINYLVNTLSTNYLWKIILMKYNIRNIKFEKLYMRNIKNSHYKLFLLYFKFNNLDKKHNNIIIYH